MTGPDCPVASASGVRVCRLEDVPRRVMDPILARQEALYRERFGPPLASAVSVLASEAARRRVEGFFAERGGAAGYLATARFPDADVVGTLWMTPGHEDLLPELVGPVLEARRRDGRRLEAQDLTFGENDPGPTLARYFTFSRERLYMSAATNREQATSHDTGYRLRQLRREDLLSCAAVAARAFASSPDVEISLSYASLEANLDRLTLALRGDAWGGLCPGSSLVAVDGAGIVSGFSVVTRLAPGVGHLFEMAVAPEARGRGLGRRLLDRSMRASVAQGLERMTLSVTVENTAALNLYQSRGFHPVRAFHAHVLVAGKSDSPSARRQERLTRPDDLA